MVLCIRRQTWPAYHVFDSWRLKSATSIPLRHHNFSWSRPIFLNVYSFFNTSRFPELFPSMSERESRSQRKSKITEAVANRGVDADAPRWENEDQKKKRKKTSRCTKCVEKVMIPTTLSRRKDVHSEKKKRPFLNQTDLVTQTAPKRRGEGWGGPVSTRRRRLPADMCECQPQDEQARSSNIYWI